MQEAEPKGPKDEAFTLRRMVVDAWRGEEPGELSDLDALEDEEALGEEPRAPSAMDLGPMQQPVRRLRVHECGVTVRPCPRTACRLHLNHDADKRKGTCEVETCSLDTFEHGDDGLKLEEIGDLLGLTKERVRQIEAIALRKLSCKTSVRRLHHESTR